MRDYKIDTGVPQEGAPQQIFITSGAGAIVVIAIFLFSVVVLYATSRNENSATHGIWGSALFFGLATPIALMAANGTFGVMYRVWQEQRTIRLLNAPNAPQRPQSGLQVVEYPQLPYEAPTAPQPPALPQYSTFVAPTAEPDDSIMREAAAWLLHLYGPDGTPDPKKVLLKSDKERPGRVRIAAPSRPAKQLLLDRSVLLDLGTGFRLNLVRCPTLMAAQNHLAQASGGGGAHAYHPPSLAVGQGVVA